MKDIRCIVAIVERGLADKIIKEAKKAGAHGATVFYGRGSGEQEAMKFFNLAIESQKEILLILVEESNFENIYRSVVKAGNLKKPGTGIAFSFPVDHLVGLHHREIIRELNID